MPQAGLQKFTVPQLHLGPLTLEMTEMVRQWRLADELRAGLRTPFMLTWEMQEDFYRRTVCDRNSHHRYWAVMWRRDAGAPPFFVGMTGLVDVAWENGTGEISLVVSPDYPRRGIGTGAVWLVLREAFERLRLQAVWGEVYYSNRVGLEFWRRVAKDYDAHTAVVPCRKFWDGEHWSSMIFTILRSEWDRAKEGVIERQYLTRRPE